MQNTGKQNQKFPGEEVKTCKKDKKKRRGKFSEEKKKEGEHEEGISWF